MTKLSRKDSEMDGPYEQRNDSIRHLKGVLQRSPFIRAEWGNDGTRVSMLMDTRAEISLIDESVNKCGTRITWETRHPTSTRGMWRGYQFCVNPK